jgi:hypothetical protein
MATSGSYNTNKYTTSSHGTIGLNLSWSVKSQNIANNTTTISWTLKSNGTMSSGYYVKAGPVTCTINGTKVVHTTSRFDMKGNGGYKKTGTLTITHTADGSKSISFSVQAAIYSASVNCTLSKTGVALPTINRYAQITSIEDFTNESYPTLVYSNPAGTSLTTGLKCRLAWDVNGTTNYSSWVTLNDEGGEYTFTSSTLTAANITSILNANPDSEVVSVTCELQSTFNGTDGSVTAVTLMTIVNSEPLVGQATYYDINNAIINKTNNRFIIVQNQSTLRIEVDGVAALNGASILTVELEINDIVYTMSSMPSATGHYYYDFVCPSLSGEVSAFITVFDTRGFSTNISNFSVIVQPWEAPTALYTLERINGFETSTILYVSGSISSVSGTNTMTIQEQHKKTDESTWSSATTIANQTNVTLSLNNAYSWDVRVIVSDKYTTTQYESSVGKGVPIMFIDKDRNSVAVNGFPDANNQIYVGGTIKAKPNSTDAGVVFPHTYSETEQIVGYWIDGRPIYEKTIVSSTEVTVSANAWKSPAFTISDVNVTVISGLPFYWSPNNSVFVIWNFMCIQSNTSDKKKVDLYNSRNASCQVNRLTVQYIKD